MQLFGVSTITSVIHILYSIQA